MHLLIATGGAPHSQVAIQFAAHLLQQHPDIIARTTIVTVIKANREHRQAEINLAQALKVFRSVAPQVQTKIRLGQPVEEILAEAQQNRYDLLIIGERPTHRLATRFLGSTALKIAEHAVCPVLIAKAEIKAIRQILLCDSGGGSQSLLMRFKAQLPLLAAKGINITILHVMSQITAAPNVRGKQLRANAQELIQEHAPEGELLLQGLHLLAREDLLAKPKIRHGLVVDEILSEAQSEAYDLVVIGSHKNEGWPSLLLDNLARQLLVKVSQPVLVLR